MSSNYVNIPVTQADVNLLKTQYPNLKIVTEANGKSYISATTDLAKEIRSALAGRPDTNGVGTTVQGQNKGIIVSEETKAYNITFQALADKMNLPAPLQDDFKKFLGTKGFAVAEGGEMAIDSSKGAEFNAALKEFAESHKENFIDPNKKFVTFDETSDQATIGKMAAGESPAITVDGEGRRYKINDESKLNEVLTEQVEEVKYEDAATSEATLEAETTITKKVSDSLVPPEDLKNNKAGRKELQEAAEKRFKEMYVDNESRRAAVDLYVIEAKHAGKIAKIERQIQKEWLSNPNNNNVKNKREMNGADIIKMYLDKYGDTKTTKSDGSASTLKADFMADVDNLLNSNTPEARKALDDARKGLNVAKGTTADQLSQRELALVAVAKAKGVNPSDILKFMAVEQYLTNRTDKQKASDDAYFIKHQAEDYVKNQQAQQDVQRPLNYADINKHGKKLVENCARLVGNEITQEDFNKGGGNYYSAKVKDPKTGEMVTKYFEFDSNKYRTILKIACNPTSATEDDLKNYVKYLQDGGCSEQDIVKTLEDLNMTLQEGRDAMTLNLPTNTGSFATLDQIIGNGKPGTNNRELNRLRHMVKEAGLSVDTNTTNAKRLLHILKEAGIGFGLGALTGGLGALLTGPAKFAAQELVGNTAGQWARGSLQFKTSGGVTQFTTDDQFVTHTETVNLNGRNNTFTWTTKVPGQTYDVQYDGKTYNVEVKDGDLWVEGQPYKVDVPGSTINHIWKQAKNSGLIGGVGGTIHGIATAGKIHAQGRNIDDVYSITKEEKIEERKSDNFKFEIPQYQSTEVRQGKTSEALASKACKLRVKHVRDGLNRGETMEDMVAQYYNVQRGTEDYKKVFEFVQKFNQLKRFGGMQYPLHNVINLPDFIPESVLGHKIDRVANPEDPKERLDLRKQDIPTTNGKYNPPAAKKSRYTENKYIKGTITKG